MTSPTRCRRCNEPLQPSYIGSSCPVCEYEDETGHRLERIPGRPVMEDVELLQLLEIEPATTLQPAVTEAERYSQAVDAA